MRFAASLPILPLLLLLPLPIRAQGASCPPGMALVDSFCIDRWEATIVGQSPYDVPTGGTAATAPGAVPQGYISGTVAAAACATAGKRLCTDTEWLRACRGPTTTIYPYGDVLVADACNDTRAEHPVITLFGAGATFSFAQLNDPQLNQLPDTVDPTGSNAQCVSAEGVFDLHGNLNEWTSDPTGTTRGGNYVEAFVNGQGCLYRTTANNSGYHDFSTGFRCCADPGAAAPVPGLQWPWLLVLPAAILVVGLLARQRPARA